MSSADVLEPPDATPPAGLPDSGVLARLANQFFAALPGQLPDTPAGLRLPQAGGVALPTQPQPAGLTLPPGVSGPSTPSALPFGALPPGAGLLPSSPAVPAQALASLPARAPHAEAPNGVPDGVLTTAPAYDGRLGGHALGVPPASRSLPGGIARHPEAPGAALDPATLGVSPPRTPEAGASPFYFLNEAGPSGGERPQALTPSPAAGLALPSRHDVLTHALVDPRPAAGPTPTGIPAPRPPARGEAAPGFYFLDVGPAAVPPLASTGPRPFDVHAVRRDFPILQERVNGRPLVWFDNAATTQKPQAVIDRIAHFYAHENSNIHRAAHELAARATDAHEEARETVRRFIGAGSTEEIIFVRGTTEAINLVAKSWGAKHIGAGDEIIVSHLEHHANIVPWQQLAAEKGVRIRVIPVDDDGQVLLDEFQKLLNDRTKLVSVTQVSNALGTVVPVQKIVEIAHRAGVRTLVDGAQSISHMKVDVRALDTDFFVFSGHKIFGPTGIGVVYGKREILEDTPPWQGGGNMIADVTFERTVFQPPPNKFEAGTGNIADAVGLGAALEYVERLGIEAIGQYEHALLDYATGRMRPIPGVRLIGTAADKASVLSFVLEGYTTEAVGKALNQEGLAVRTGHHCAQPILRRCGLETTVRPSLAFYNTCEEVDRMVAVVERLARARS